MGKGMGYIDIWKKKDAGRSVGELEDVQPALEDQGSSMDVPGMW